MGNASRRNIPLADIVQHRVGLPHHKFIVRFELLASYFDCQQIIDGEPIEISSEFPNNFSKVAFVVLGRIVFGVIDLLAQSHSLNVRYLLLRYRLHLVDMAVLDWGTLELEEDAADGAE